MSVVGWGQIGLLALLIGVLVKPLGGYLARVYASERTVLKPILGPIETALYRLAELDTSVEQKWSEYAVALLVFNAVGTVALYLLLRIQGLLPLNPQQLSALSPDLAFDTALSFVTNTSWQSYSGEVTLSYLAQMVGIAVQSFLSAATGMAVAMALIRAFARRSASTIGNFWIDLTRGTLYVLLPICVAAAVFFVAQGVPQTLAQYIEAKTITGGTQLIALGPVATQEAIKLLSGDGGGFFNVNSAHPFENPTPLTNLVEMVLILSLGAALTNTFGRMVGNEKQGWALLATMTILFGLGVAGLYACETGADPALTTVQIDQAPEKLQVGGNMEGKEVRFGIAASALFAEASTASSDGAVDAMHDSFLPLSGAILFGNMMVDEVIIGAPGSGLWGILLFCLVAVFIAGLMIGRTPEFVGKKIEAREITMAMLALLAAPALSLGLTALASVVALGLAGPCQCWTARLLRDPLRLYIGGGHQRQRLCRVEHEHAFLQSDACAGDVRGSVLDHRAGARNCRLARGQTVNTALRWYPADGGPSIRSAARRDDRDCRRSHFPSGAVARAAGRALRHAGGVAY